MTCLKELKIGVKTGRKVKVKIKILAKFTPTREDETWKMGSKSNERMSVAQ